MSHYARITVGEAKYLWGLGRTIYLVPSKCVPGGGWALECPIKLTNELKEQANSYAPDGQFPNEKLWKGTMIETSWQLIINAWKWSNTCWELGYYPHYYIKLPETERKN